MEDLPVDRYAASLGLPGAPKIKFLKKGGAGKNTSFAAQRTDNDDGSDSGSGSEVGSDEVEAKLTVSHTTHAPKLPSLS